MFLFFIGFRGVIGTFLLHGLRTEFKRIWPCGLWAGAVTIGPIAFDMGLCVPVLGGIATTVRSSFRLKSVSNPMEAVKVPFIQRNPMNNDTPFSLKYIIFYVFPSFSISSIFQQCVNLLQVAWSDGRGGASGGMRCCAMAPSGSRVS